MAVVMTRPDIQVVLHVPSGNQGLSQIQDCVKGGSIVNFSAQHFKISLNLKVFRVDTSKWKIVRPN